MRYFPVHGVGSENIGVVNKNENPDDTVRRSIGGPDIAHHIPINIDLIPVHAGPNA